MRALSFLPIAFSLALVACGGSSFETTPGGDDAATDGAPSDATSDGTTDDTASDSSVAETSTDASSDGSDGSSGDTAVSETAPEASVDAKPDAPSDTADKTCGGIAGLKCGVGEYCEYPIGTCKTPDASGTCKSIPTGCTKELDPVCGCDGKDYGNPCMAAAAGTSVAHKGACPKTGGCGGKLGGTCASNEYCDYPEGAMCGATDIPGTCKPRPEFCSGLYDPVCGCDGKTYSNACTAASAGVDYAKKGPC